MPKELEKLRRRISPKCLSDFQLDRLLTDEAAHQPGSELQHLRDCPLCAQKLRLRKESMSDFNTKLDVDSLSFQAVNWMKAARKNKHRLWLRRFFVLAPAATAVIVLVGFFVLPHRHQPDNDVNRVKGPPSFGVTVKRNQAVFSGDNGGVFYPGDQLVFHVNASRTVYFSLFNVEQTGKVSRFAPTQGGHAIRLPIGQKTPTATGIELDASIGQEYLVGIFCPRSYDLLPIHTALRDWDRQPTSLSAIISTVLFHDCTHALFHMTKIKKTP